MSESSPREYAKVVECDDPAVLKDQYPDVPLWIHEGANVWREATVSELDEYEREMRGKA